MQVGRTIARTVAPLALAVFIAAGCGGDNGVLGVGGIPSDSFCSVNGQGLKTKDFDKLVDGAKQQYKDNGRDFPKKNSAELKTLRSQAVDFLVQQQLIRGQADKLGVKVSNKDVDKGVKEMKKQYFQGDEKKFASEMKRVGYTEARVRDDIEYQKLSDKLYKKITGDIKVTDKDAQKYFDDNQSQFVTKESRDVAHILVKTKKQADQIYALVKGGDKAVFAAQAKKFTQDPSSKETGGVLTGGIQRGQTVPEFDKTAFALKTDEISQPVKTSFGYHIITARGAIKPETKQKFAKVKPDIKKQLQGTKESERFQEWQKDIKADAVDDVKCNDDFTWTETQSEKEKAKDAKAASDAAAKAAETAAPADGAAPAPAPAPADGAAPAEGAAPVDGAAPADKAPKEDK